MNREVLLTIEKIVDIDPRYKEDAYLFIMEALSFTQKKYKCQKHVTGHELLEGMRELLMEKYGPLTMSVLNYWGISSTEDFGRIVFNLVEHKVLSKTEEDKIEEFQNAYNFEEVFSVGYRKHLEKKLSRMKSF